MATEYGMRLRAARKHANLTQVKLSELTGIAQSTISTAEREGHGSSETPVYAKVCGVDAHWLATGKGQMLATTSLLAPSAVSNVAPAPAPKAFRSIAVVGEVKAGDHGYMEELQYPAGYGDGTVDFPTSDPLAYAVRVRGDSMHPRYRAGEFVVVEPSVEALPGDDVVVALVDGRKLLKELGWRRDGEVQLLSVNNHFGPMTIECSNVASIQLVAGRVRRGAINKP